MGFGNKFDKTFIIPYPDDGSFKLIMNNITKGIWINKTFLIHLLRRENWAILIIWLPSLMIIHYKQGFVEVITFKSTGQVESKFDQNHNFCIYMI